MSFTLHTARMALIMILAGILLCFLSARTEIIFADGLRYIRQGQELERGNLSRGLLGSVDHPVYPASIALIHASTGGEGAAAWQAAAQAASVLAGIFLVVPLYLVALEVFGPRSAWLGCLLFYTVPLNAHVFADGLSESTFLLFWTWGLWAALRFLRQGSLVWLPLMVVFSAISYLTRPEGLLLPAAMVATLAAMPLLRTSRLNWPKWWGAVVFLVIGPACLIGPYVATKGGLGTKPAIARLLGTAPQSSAQAVERSRPLVAGETRLKTTLVAGREVISAFRKAVSWPLLPFAFFALGLRRRDPAGKRITILLVIILAASFLALMRLHATGGYCTPRHALVPAMIIILAAAAGLDRLLGAIRIPARWLGQEGSDLVPGPAIWILFVGGYLAWSGPSVLKPVNAESAAYKEAGEWLAQNVPVDSKVVDVTGWAHFYGARSGYTFADLIYAPGDASVRYVVARDAHLIGPWEYCERLRELTAGLKPVASFPSEPDPKVRQARVHVFDRQARASQVAASPGAEAKR